MWRGSTWRLLQTLAGTVPPAAAGTKDVQFGQRKKDLTERRGYRRAIVALGRKILRFAFAMLRDREPYRNPDLDYDQLPAQRNQARWVRALRKAGLLPAAAAVPSAPAKVPPAAT